MANQEAPVYQRTTAIQPSVGVQDFGGVAREYAESTNFLSAIGSKVASAASNEMAMTLGAEAGKNPKENAFLLPITEFDKNFAQSYTTQAQVTLGLQANKLITDSSLQLASAPRVTPGMLADQQKQVSQGLQKIIAMAPASVRPHMEMQYGNVLLNQQEQISNRMISEQRQDRRNHTQYMNQVAAENAYTLRKAGKDAEAEAILRQTESINKSAVSDFIFDETGGKTAVDTVRRANLQGKYDSLVEKAYNEGNQEKVLKSWADKQPSDLSDADYPIVMQGALSHVNQLQQLRSQNEQLQLAQFSVAVAKNPNDAAIPTLLDNLRQNVSPIAYEHAQLNYIQAQKAFNRENGDVSEVEAHWNDTAALTRAPTKALNKGFDNLVAKYMEKNNVSRDEAEIQVAAPAGRSIPIFTETLSNKLKSGNPNNIQSASLQVQRLRDLEAGHALEGLDKKAEVIAFQFAHQRGSMPDSDLARKITDNLSRVDSTMQTTLDNQWNMILSSKSAGGLGATKSLSTLALSEVGLGSKEFGGAYFKTIYGNDIYSQLKSNFDSARGDYDAAKAMTQAYVDRYYGETRFNGGIQFTDRPIEKTLGYKDYDVVPFIQQDLLNQLEKKFQATNTENNTWSIKPVQIDQSADNRSHFRSRYAPAEVIQRVKTKDGIKEYSYPISLIGRPDNKWDVVLSTPDGQHNLFLVAPHLGLFTYEPDQESIKTNYSKHVISRWF